jgi:hypothetical protein
MASMLSPQLILLVYWLMIVVIAAFCMRMASSLCQADIPSWPRAVISVVVVTFLAYVTADFSAYMIVRSMQDVVVQIPPGYGYNHWFREAFAFKWAVVSHAGPLRYLPFIFGLCVAGMLQVIVLQASITFRWGLAIFLLEVGATAVAGYLLSLVFGIALNAIGWTPPAVEVAPSSGQVQGQTGSKDTHAGAGTKTAKYQGKTAGQKTPGGVPSAAPQKGPDAKQPFASPNSLHETGQDGAGTTEQVTASVQDVLHNLKNYANSHLDDVKEEMAPVTRHLPEPIRDFLDGGGWWLVIGIVGIITLLWLRSTIRKLRGAVSAALPRRKRKKPRTKVIAINLKVKLAKIGEAVTEEGPTRILVNGVPARLRLVVLSLGSRNAGTLTEEMADRVLDWIKPGLAAVSSGDYPTIRIWPPFFSAGGFASAVGANVLFPELVGEQSHWVVVVGQVKMGQAIVNVALGLHADEPNSMRILKVSGNQWLGILGVQEPRHAAMAR